MKIKQVIAVYDKTKDGKPFITQKGKPYRKQTVKFEEHGEKLVTVPVLGSDLYKEGDVLDGEITEREWNGNKYYDFKFSSKNEEIEKIKFNQIKLDNQVKKIIEILKKNFPREFGLRTEPPIPFSPETLANPEKAKKQFEQAVKETMEDLQNMKEADINAELDLEANELFEKF